MLAGVITTLRVHKSMPNGPKVEAFTEWWYGRTTKDSVLTINVEEPSLDFVEQVKVDVQHSNVDRNHADFSPFDAGFRGMHQRPRPGR